MCEEPANQPLNSGEDFAGLSMHYQSPTQFLQQSLDLHLIALNSLCTEMDNYTGPTAEEIIGIQSDMQKWMSNPSLIWSRRFEDVLDEQVVLHSEPSTFFSTKFSRPFMTHAVPVIILSCALGEALINGIVATGLTLRKREKFFEMFDRLDLKQKWILGPELIDENCKIDQGNSLFERLTRLIYLRNALVHGKATVRVGSDSASLRGKDLAIEISAKSAKSIASMSQLPRELFDHVMSNIPEGDFKFYLSIAKIDRNDP